MNFTSEQNVEVCKLYEISRRMEMRDWIPLIYFQVVKFQKMTGSSTVFSKGEGSLLHCGYSLSSVLFFECSDCAYPFVLLL